MVYLYFYTKKSQFGDILKGLEIKNVRIFYGHLEYFKAFWYFYSHLVSLGTFWYIFYRFGILHQDKSGNPVSDDNFWNRLRGEKCSSTSRALFLQDL
jgi:hypothetical protein